jgi:hypothetical protein
MTESYAVFGTLPQSLKGGFPKHQYLQYLQIVVHARFAFWLSFGANGKFAVQVREKVIFR